MYPAVVGFRSGTTLSLRMTEPLFAFLAIFIFVACAQEYELLENAHEDSLFGYDFSQGYTSLEKSVPPESASKPGLIQRWLLRRRTLRDERQRAKAEEAERELDFLLAKVHTYGIDSLTDSERRILKRASARYKGRTKS